MRDQLRCLGRTGWIGWKHSITTVRATALNVDRLPAETASATVHSLRRHPAAGFPHRVFPLSGSPLATPVLKAFFGALRQQDAPCRFEIRTSLVKRRSHTARMIFDVAAGMEAATPAPLVDAF